MALVNPNIAMSYRGIELPQQNALADYAAIQQIQGGRQAQELNALKMQEAQRTAKSQNVLADAYAQSIDETGKIDYNKLTGLVAAGGGGAQLPGIQKSRFEQESASTKLLADKLALLPEAYKRADTPEAYLTLHQSVHADPILGPWLKSTGATPEKGLATLQNAVKTGKFDELRMGSMQSVAQLLEGMKPITVSPGASVFQGGKSVFTAPVAPVVPKQTDLQLNYQAAKEQGFVGSIFDYEKKLKEAGRPPAQARAPAITTVEDPNNPGKFLQVDANQYRGGGANAPGVIGGARPSAAAEKVAAQKVQLGKDLGFAITQLDEVTKDGGLIDQSTGSGAGRLVDIGAGFVGKATPGAIAIGKLAPIADLVLKMGPRFEGPQSDKDTKSYKEAAGQLADPTLPTEIRKAAGKTVLRLMRERKNQFVTTDMATEGTPAAASVAPPPGFNPD
jgi:hypothetical protein